MSNYEVILVSDDKVATLPKVEANSNVQAGRRAVQIAEKAYPSRIFVVLNTRKWG